MNLGKIPDSSVSPKNPSTHVSNKNFNPMAFLKLWGDKMQLMQQQPQMIVVESRADKSWETKAKFINHMLQLLLVSGDVDFTLPGTFAAPRILIYTQAIVKSLPNYQWCTASTQSIFLPDVSIKSQWILPSI
jgi:hypothetical protein